MFRREHLRSPHRVRDRPSAFSFVGDCFPSVAPEIPLLESSELALGSARAHQSVCSSESNR